MSNLIDKINSPTDLKTLSEKELQAYCNELREFLIHSIFQSGGHFAGNLGVVELSVAIHKIFDSPLDPIIWDVGHQSYAHKVITGRKKDISQIRHLHGISGFPKREENNHDAFGTGHSSTAISAALGMAKAFSLKHLNHTAIAIVGDGALTGGMAFEAINHMGVENANVLVIINDNHIGIDPNTGAINNLLPHLQQDSHNFFEQLGIPYFGPIDGHDLSALLMALSHLKELPGPKILHVKTIKGKGFEPAEKEQTSWHATNKYVKVEAPDIPKKSAPKWQEVFGDLLCALAEKNEKICGITPAMPTGSGMIKAMKQFPNRFWDVGIAEQHAVTFAAGLAAQGLKPFCNIYSSFAQRAYDQIIHDVALQNLPVVFCLDRAGLVGEDGPTHHGAFDLAFLNPIPNLQIAAPRDIATFSALMHYAEKCEVPLAIRYPKGEAPQQLGISNSDILPGKAQVLMEGNKIAIIGLGHSAAIAFPVALHFSPHISLIDAVFLKPLDQEIIQNIFKNFDHIITIEDGILKGGLFSSIAELATQSNYQGKIYPLGIPNEFIEHGPNAALYEISGYGPNKIKELISAILSDSPNS